MPISVANTTLSLSQIDQLREIVLQTNNILGTTIDPFTLENLNKSDWWQYEFARQVLSTTLVSEGYPALPDFTITQLNNNTLANSLIENINASLQSGGSTQLLLIPTGATETADGEYQRFEWDGETLNPDNQGAWEANLPAEDRGDAYRIQMKMPVMVSDDPVFTVRVGNAPSYLATIDNSDGNRVIFEAVYVADNLAAELRLYGMSVLGGEQTFTTLVIAPAPAAGTVITLDVTQTTAVMSWGNESYPLVITSGALPSPSDVLAYSYGFEPPLPLSIKVQSLAEG